MTWPRLPLPPLSQCCPSLLSRFICSAGLPMPWGFCTFSCLRLEGSSPRSLLGQLTPRRPWRPQSRFPTPPVRGQLLLSPAPHSAFFSFTALSPLTCVHYYACAGAECPRGRVFALLTVGTACLEECVAGSRGPRVFTE